ncbi:MAG: RNA polymerase sigma factor [Planctomycetota bacterium]
MNGTIEQLAPTASEAASLAASTDEQLLLEYRQRGSRRSFEELVRRYEKEMFGYLRHYLGDSEMAEDVFQQTFLQVHLKVDQYEPGRQVRPWLYTVATNQAIDYQRRNRRHRMASLDRRSGSSGDDDNFSLAHALGCASPGPAEQSESAEQYDEVRRAVDELPEQTRQVVHLVYFQGLKYREAADIMEIPVGTVKSRLHAALAKLQETFSRTKHPR